MFPEFARHFLSRPFALKARRVFLALVILMAVLKLVAVFVYVPGDRSIFDLGFSFDPYVRSLHDGLGFQSCVTENCDHSSRMPGLPLFLGLISAFTTSLRAAAIIKAILFSALVYLTCRGVGERLVVRSPFHFAFYAAVTAFIVLAPNLIKHASVAHYEEGYVLELLAITAVSALTLISADPKNISWATLRRSYCCGLGRLPVQIVIDTGVVCDVIDHGLRRFCVCTKVARRRVDRSGSRGPDFLALA